MKIKNSYLKNIFKGNKRGKIIFIGPCSIHSFRSFIEYQKKFNKSKKKKKKIIMVMRIFFEKPRTTVGWKGLIYDPYLNNKYNIKKGIKICNKILEYKKKKKIISITEFLNPFLSDLIKKNVDLCVIGARNCESQVHREMASDLKIPVGFKNDVYGNIKGSINSIISIKNKTIRLLIKKNKLLCKKTIGNDYGFLILRGGKSPNYKIKNLIKVSKYLKKKKIKNGFVVDFSHGNSKKDHNKQINIYKYFKNKVFINIKLLIGIMIESHIKGGVQKKRKKIRYNQSITDPCLSWKKTEKILKDLNKNCYKIIL